jgi:hypothetical protein
MKSKQDEAVAEVRSARKALCERFGNDPRRLLKHLRDQQRQYHGKVIKDWSELKSALTLAERPEGKPKRK